MSANIICHVQYSILNNTSAKSHFRDVLHNFILVWDILKKRMLPDSMVILIKFPSEKDLQYFAIHGEIWKLSALSWFVFARPQILEKMFFFFFNFPSRNFLFSFIKFNNIFLVDVKELSDIWWWHTTLLPHRIYNNFPLHSNIIMTLPGPFQMIFHYWFSVLLFCCTNFLVFKSWSL